MIIDTHTHTLPWSPDGAQKVEELISGAGKKQLGGVVLTDHYDYNSITDGKPWKFDPQEYYEFHMPYRKEPSRSSGKQERNPGFLLGVEISFCRNHIPQMLDLAANAHFDQVIMSLHDFKGTDPVVDPGDFFSGSIEEVYGVILNEIACSMDLVKQSDICGHFDFFSRYAPIKDPKMRYRQAPDAFDHLFRVLIKNEQGLEINTGTIAAFHEKRKMPLEEAFPDKEIICRYWEMGGRIITLGSDAHNSTDIARYFDAACEWLKSMGIRELFWMENRHWCSSGI